ncbi:MAG: M23 family metallopeptidase, partial [Minisyncoccia bacterium]
NGTQTVYAHMSTNKVSVGDWVTQGQTIGAIGMTGKTSGPHLHFEVRGAKNPF